MRRWRCPAPALGLLSLLLLAGTGCEAPRRVLIPVHGRTLEALYWEPAKRLSPAVLLAAPRGQQKESWVALGTRLRKQGYGVLALELSPGESAGDDLRAAFEYLRLRRKVDAARIGIVGGGEAADATLEFASHEPLVRTVVLLLPRSTEEEMKPLLRQYGYRARLVTEVRMDPQGAAIIHQQLGAEAAARPMVAPQFDVREFAASEKQQANIVEFLARHL